MEQRVGNNDRKATPERRRMRLLVRPRGVRLPILFFALSLLAVTTRVQAQITWLNLEDGDILNVSRASGLEPGHVKIDVGRSLETSDAHGEILMHHFSFSTDSRRT